MLATRPQLAKSIGEDGYVCHDQTEQMAGDDLTISLFFVGLAVTIAATGMTQAGWKHRLLIFTLFAVAAVLFGVGAGWHWIKGYWPEASAVAATLATNPVTWFVVIMFGLGAILFRRTGIQTDSISRRVAAPAAPVTASPA